MIAETLLAVAFDALDQSPDDPRVLTLLRRVNAGSYDRLSGNPAESSPEMHKAQNQAADSFNVKSLQPGPADAP